MKKKKVYCDVSPRRKSQKSSISFPRSSGYFSHLEKYSEYLGKEAEQLFGSALTEIV